jgi:hypothetical protein
VDILIESILKVNAVSVIVKNLDILKGEDIKLDLIKQISKRDRRENGKKH